ncbi:hypothetical protein AHF37_01886 [Paragonimus kellicotti]|nr:hypothetical protein AHF37_01886 [Paragonimus kellicotti]
MPVETVEPVPDEVKPKKCGMIFNHQFDGCRCELGWPDNRDAVHSAEESDIAGRTAVNNLASYIQDISGGRNSIQATGSPLKLHGLETTSARIDELTRNLSPVTAVETLMTEQRVQFDEYIHHIVKNQPGLKSSKLKSGLKPLYADRLLVTEDPDITRLNKQTYEFLLNLLAAVETNDLRTQGLYRISGVKSKIATLVRQAMSPTGVPSSTLLTCDIHLLTGAVKHFVRHLDEPLMTYSLHYSFLNAIKKNPADRLQELGRLLSQLPAQNREALKALIVHLAKVSAESRFNNMTPSNLGIVFAPSLLRSPEETVAAIMNTKFASTAIELMIENHTALFGLTSSGTGSTVSTGIPTRPTALVEPVYVTPIPASSLKNQSAYQLPTSSLFTPCKSPLQHEVDEQMLQDRQKFISHAFEHVTNIHEAEELKKSKFVQTISLFMHMLGNFHHQAYEHFQDAQRQLAAINIAAQRSSENFRQICDETKELKEKLLKTPWEKIQSIDSASFREGYLFIPVKRAMTTLWIKHFCVYSRDVKSLYITPYTQGRASDLTTESYSVHSCVRRSTDSIDRRFCFDVETANRFVY